MKLRNQSCQLILGHYRFSIAVFIEERREGLFQLMKRLYSGEDVVGPLQSFSHCIGHLDFFKRSIQDFRVCLDEVLYFRFFYYLNFELCPFDLVERLHHSLEEAG